MAKDMSDVVRDVVSRAAKEAMSSIGDVNPAKKSKSNGGLSGMRGLAAGAGLAAVATKGVSALRALPSPAKAAEKATSKVGDKVSGVASDKVDEAGGAGGMLKDAVSGALPFGGGDDDAGPQDGMPGVGKGRRMPIQQAVDVAVPLEIAYNQWTQFEDWPEFMHRVTRVTQEDECTVSFATKIWGKTKEFKAEIVTQRPDDRIKWRVSEGITHSGVVSFHELAPRLTRIEIDLDIDPGSLIEKAARGMRHIKRAVRADLHRYKAFIEMQEIESGAWRGQIEGGEVIEEHDGSYDRTREYADIEDIQDYATPNGQDEDEDGDDSEKLERFKRQAEQSRRSASRSTASKSPASSSKSGGSKAKSSGSSSRGNGSGSKAKSSGSSSKSSGSSSKSNGSGAKAKSSSSSRSRSTGGSRSRGTAKKSSGTRAKSTSRR